jgi:ectoine hydroxylase-related dioxygenase (phytanoyl-CoA dioxygenase family)
MTDGEISQLDEQGFAVFRNFLNPATLAALRKHVEDLFEQEGENAGSEFRQEPFARRLANLVDKGEIFRKVFACPPVLDAVAHVLGPRFKLSSLNARSADPYSSEAQPLHCDAGSLPDARGNCVCNTIWLLDDFTPENGATRIVPGSHKWGLLPQKVLVDPSAPHPDEVLVLGPAGSVVVMNTHAWHGGTANRTSLPRRALHSFYCRWDQPQQQYQKRLLRPETQAALTPELRRLLALDDPANDELCAAATGMSGFMQ